MNEVTFEITTSYSGKQELRPVCETAFNFRNLCNTGYLDHGHMHWIEVLGYKVKLVKATSE